MFVHYQDRIPRKGAVVMVSNHRSFMDAPLLMAAIDRPIRFACHHYMGQVPLMRDIVTRLGCFPLDTPNQRRQSFFHQASQLLGTGQAVGVFPEGAEPMVKLTPPDQMGAFQRGFAHLALRAPVQDLAILPVAIAAHEENNHFAFPLRLLGLFDPSEPLFDQSGWHPMVIYRHVTVLIGRPIWLTPAQQQSYHGKRARTMVNDLTAHCQTEIAGLLY
jgi:1-acyl-sn-glycerol-3-phosphate acyltransferase